jgi:hypothetical protein
MKSKVKYSSNKKYSMDEFTKLYSLAKNRSADMYVWQQEQAIALWLSELQSC